MIMKSLKQAILAKCPNVKKPATDWAFIHESDGMEARINIFNDEDGTGLVEVIATEDDGRRTDISFTPTVELAKEILQAAIVAEKFEAKLEAERNR